MIKVSMISLTYANKSKVVLEKLGYKSNIIHNVTKNGCEYVLIVDAPRNVVSNALDKEGIPIKEFL